MNVELIVEHENSLIVPVVEDGIEWSTGRKGTPGQLNFKYLNDSDSTISEGDAVRVKVDENNMFFGFVFKKQTDKTNIVKVTAYDQLRYLKNKDTYVYENKTAGDVVRMLANDFRLNIGDIEDTKYRIPSRVEDNKTLFDIIQTALDLTLENQNNMYVLFDDFGKIAVKSLDSMRISGLLIDAETGENYDYTSSIDSDTYNKIKLTYENEDTGKREVYIAQDGEHINQWGVLQYFETLQKGENGSAKADALLKLYNSKTRSLQIKKAFGDIRVRAGSMVAIQLDLGDVKIQNYMLVEKCKHTFNENEHLMDLTVRGGEFVG